MNIYKLNFGREYLQFDNQIKQEILTIRKEAEQNTSLAVKGNSHPRAVLINVGSQITALISKVNTHFGVNASKIDAVIKSVDLGSLRTKSESKIKLLDKTIRSLEIDVARIEPPTKLASVWKYKIGIGICVLLDCILNFRSFQVWVDNLLIAIISALLTAACIGYLADITGKRLVNSKSNRIKLIVFSISILSVLLVFYLLSVMRIYYYADSDVGSISPILWCLFNLFFYCIAVLLSMNNSYTDEQLKTNKYLKQLTSKIKLLESEKESIIGTLNKNENILKDYKSELLELTRFHELLLKSIEMERNQICAKCLLDYELRGGSIPYSQIITELQINKS